MNEWMNECCSCRIQHFTNAENASSYSTTLATSWVTQRKLFERKNLGTTSWWILKLIFSRSVTPHELITVWDKFKSVQTCDTSIQYTFNYWTTL